MLGRTNQRSKRRRASDRGRIRTIGAVLGLTLFVLRLSPPRAAAQESAVARPTTSKAQVIVVVGAEGTPEYGEQFRAWAARWRTAAQRGGALFSLVGVAPPNQSSDRDQLRELLTKGASADSLELAAPLWLVLIGHGTFDGKTARFNLRGPDFTAAELGEWLKPMRRPVAVINCASSSGPFLTELSGPNRIVVTATKSGFEYNIARFGDYLSSAIADPAADLDKDEQTSLLEAYLRAAAGVKEFYAQDGRLATEHPLLDDNGDRLGTPPDWFQGVRAVKAAKAGATLDGVRAAQWVLAPNSLDERLSPDSRARRDEIEAELAKLRSSKSSLPEEEYLRLIEPLLLELARIYAMK